MLEEIYTRNHTSDRNFLHLSNKMYIVKQMHIMNLGLLSPNLSNSNQYNITFQIKVSHYKPKNMHYEPNVGKKICLGE